MAAIARNSLRMSSSSQLQFELRPVAQAEANAPKPFAVPILRRWNLFLWGCTLAQHVEAAMPLTGPIPEGRSFFCPHCGALYGVTYSRQSNSDSNIAKCVVCGRDMAKWDSTNVPTYKLVHRPDDA